jgi:hypothetical protein
MHSLEHSTKEFKSVKLSSISLGKFTYHALKCGAEIGDIEALNPNFDSSWVGVTIKIDKNKIDEFQKNSGFGLKKPQ